MDKVRVPFMYRPVEPEVAKILMDKALIEKVYAKHNIAQTAAELGTSEHKIRRAIEYHKINKRRRGETIRPASRLDDKKLVEEMYAKHSIQHAADLLGTTRHKFRAALDIHGIKVRKQGEMPPGIRLTRGAVEIAALRAYLKVGRCPISCPGRATCLNDKECTLYNTLKEKEKIHA